MKYVYVALKWTFGVFFLILGLAMLVKTLLGGGILILLSLLLFPPVRNFIYIKTNKNIPFKIIVASIFSLLVVFFGVSISQIQDKKAKDLAELTWKSKAIETELVRRSKLKEIEQSNDPIKQETDEIGLQDERRNIAHDLADIKSAKLGDREVPISTLNTVVSLTNDISLNWDHNVLKKYIEASNFIKNENTYKTIFAKNSHLGKLKKCNKLKNTEFEKSDVFAIKQDCEFVNGSALIQLVFKPKDLNNELMGMTVKEVLSEEQINCGILAYKDSNFYIKAKTLDIPFVSEEESPEFSFGCIIVKSGTFQVHYIIESSKKIIGNLSESNIHLPTSQRKIIETPKYNFAEGSHLSITLDNSDVPGPYEVRVFVDDILSKQVTFNVQ